MARIAGQEEPARSLAGAVRTIAKADAAARTQRALARERSDRRLEADRRGFHCGPFGAGQPEGRRAFRAGTATGAALPVRANLEGGNSAQIETALWNENHPRNPIPSRLNSGMVIRQIFISSGHNYFGHHGRAPDSYPLVEVEQVECVAGHGIRGDRFYDY